MAARSDREGMGPVFRALADPSRRRLLDRLNARSGLTLRELCDGLDMARQSVSGHLAVLEEAGLVTTVWRGREKLHYLNAAPIADIADRWISRYHRQRVRVLSDLKQTLEGPVMDKPEFVYTTHIRTSPERLWEALTDPSFTARYWGCTYDTDWRAGSTYAIEQHGTRIEDPDQRVLVADRPRRLSYTWHTFTRDWATANGIGDEALARFAAEGRSEVTFEIEPDGEWVKLTVVHGGFEPGSFVLESVSEGWPRVLANLKSLLETGEALDLLPRAARASS